MSVKRLIPARLSKQWRTEAATAASMDDDYQRGVAAALRRAADELDLYGDSRHSTQPVSDYKSGEGDA
jgi:hypothetical protein